MSDKVKKSIYHIHVVTDSSNISVPQVIVFDSVNAICELDKMVNFVRDIIGNDVVFCDGQVARFWDNSKV
jgi:hypothetical protein